MTHAHCYDCGLLYGSDGWVEAVIPDKVWNAIKPDGCDDGCGLLCIACIARRLKIKGIHGVPVWLCGTENLIAREGDPSERIAELRTFKPNKSLEPTRKAERLS